MRNRNFRSGSSSLLFASLLLCGTALLAQGNGAMGNPSPQPTNGGVAKLLTVTPANYSGACPVTLQVQGFVNYTEMGNGMSAPAPIQGWTIRFNFQRSDGTQSEPEVAPVNTHTPVSYTWQVTQSMQGWVQIDGELVINGTASPRSNFSSRKLSFSVNCARQPIQLGGDHKPTAKPLYQPPPPHHSYTPPNTKGYTAPAAQGSCARPVLMKLDDRSTVVGGKPAILAQAGDNMQVLANTSLPAQVIFSAGNQQGQGVSSSLNPNKLNQTQAYMATSLTVVVPSIATGSTQPVAGWVEVSNPCGASNRMPIEFQGPPAGPYRVQSGRGNLPAPQQRGFQQNQSAMAPGGNAAPTWTGVVQGAPAYFSFLLNTGEGRVLSVVGGQAHYVAGGRPVTFAALKAGMRVKVSGSLSYNKIMAREVEILPGADAAPAPK